MMMRKYLRFLAMFIFVGLFMACGGAQDSGDGGGEGEAVTADAEIEGEENGANAAEEEVVDKNTAPKDILQKVKLGTSYNYVVELFGAEHEVSNVGDVVYYQWNLTNLTLSLVCDKGSTEAKAVEFLLKKGVDAEFEHDDFLEMNGGNCPPFGKMTYYDLGETGFFEVVLAHGMQGAIECFYEMNAIPLNDNTHYSFWGDTPCGMMMDLDTYGIDYDLKDVNVEHLEMFSTNVKDELVTGMRLSRE